jgi:hypothetical protein
MMAFLRPNLELRKAVEKPPKMAPRPKMEAVKKLTYFATVSVKTLVHCSTTN